MLPSDDGVMPGAGTIGAAIEAASGVAPVVIGKPETHLVTYATSLLGIKPEDAVMVGDNMRTDILAGPMQAAGLYWCLRDLPPGIIWSITSS